MAVIILGPDDMLDPKGKVEPDNMKPAEEIIDTVIFKKGHDTKVLLSPLDNV